MYKINGYLNDDIYRNNSNHFLNNSISLIVRNIFVDLILINIVLAWYQSYIIGIESHEKKIMFI